MSETSSFESPDDFHTGPEPLEEWGGYVDDVAYADNFEDGLNLEASEDYEVDDPVDADNIPDEPTGKRPLEELFNEDLPDDSAQRPAVLPSGEAVVRRFPAPQHNEPPITTLEEAEQRIAATVKHHRILASNPDDPEKPHIIIPDTVYKAQPNPDGTFHIANITEWIDGEQFLNTEPWNTAGVDDSQRDAALEVAQTLYQYYDHILTEGTDNFLFDLSSLTQYLINKEGHPVLADTDPFALPLNTERGRLALFGDVASLKMWVTDSKLEDWLHGDLQQLYDRAAKFMMT